MNDLMPISEAAERIGVSISTLHRYLDDGRVDFTTIGQRRFPSVESVNKFIASRETVS